MQIMLVQDVTQLGRVGDIVEVKNGYARNYLIPQGFAIPATKGAIKQADQLRQTAEKQRGRQVASAQELANRLAALNLRFTAKVGERGRLYGSITTGDIAERIQQEIGVEIDRRRVELTEAIKALGNYEVPVDVHIDVPATVRVEVVGENGETAADFFEEMVPTDLSPEMAEVVVAPQPDADY